MNGLNDMKYPQAMVGQLANSIEGRRLDITLRQNIDEQINQVKKALETLHDTKARMEASGILDLRIDDIRRAMQF